MTVDRAKFGFNLQVGLFVAQVVLAAFGWWIRTELTEIRADAKEGRKAEAVIHEDQERRIRTLESFAAAGNRWTREEHYEFEAKLAEKMESIRTDLALIKRELGIKK